MREITADTKPTVLLVDNDPSALEMVEFGLKRRGYGVITADSHGSALAAIGREIFHVAVIDLRLENEKFVQDTSGFKVAESLPDYIPFIIYTAYEQKNTIKEALGKLNARASIDKTDTRAASRLLDHVETLFADEVNANFELHIEGRSSPESIARQLQIPNISDCPQPEATDICMIVKRLFPHAHRVWLSPLVSPEDAPSLSQSGSVVLQVEAETQHGTTAPAVLKISSREDIKREDENSKAIEPYIGGSRSSMSGRAAYSRGVGGLMFTFVGVPGWDSMRLLTDAVREGTTADICEMMGRFFPANFGNLYQAATVKKRDMALHYSTTLRLTAPKLLEVAAVLGIHDPLKECIQLDDLGIPVNNPLAWLIEGGGFRPFEAPIPWCLCHGDLHSRNILVDSEEHLWLVDFEKVQRGHALQDLAELESDFKFYVLPECDVRAWYLLERALVAPQMPEAAAPGLLFGRDLDHLYHIIGALRSAVFDLVAPNVDMREYYYALLWYAMKCLRLNHLSLQSKRRAFVSAAVIVERLRAWPDWEAPTQREVSPIPIWLPASDTLNGMLVRRRRFNSRCGQP